MLWMQLLTFEIICSCLLIISKSENVPFKWFGYTVYAGESNPPTVKWYEHNYNHKVSQNYIDINVYFDIHVKVYASYCQFEIRNRKEGQTQRFPNMLDISVYSN